MSTIAEGYVMHATETLVVITCCQCGIPFAVPSYWKQKRYEDQKSFWCPNGHSHYYAQSTAQRLKKELAAAKRREESARESEAFYRRQAETNKRSAAAHKAVATKRGKKLARVQAGVCPCCNRTFQNLARHMATKHPE